MDIIYKKVDALPMLLAGQENGVIMEDAFPSIHYVTHMISIPDSA